MGTRGLRVGESAGVARSALSLASSSFTCSNFAAVGQRTSGAEHGSCKAPFPFPLLPLGDTLTNIAGEIGVRILGIWSSGHIAVFGVSR